jgi:hypothetical protein
VTGIYLAVSGLVMGVVAVSGSVYSLRALRGTARGAALSLACAVAAVCGGVLAVAGVLITWG